jgi:hypothetical protein
MNSEDSNRLSEDASLSVACVEGKIHITIKTQTPPTAIHLPQIAANRHSL